MTCSCTLGQDGLCKAAMSLQFAKNAFIQLKEVEVLNCTCNIPPQNSLLKQQEMVRKQPLETTIS